MLQRNVDTNTIRRVRARSKDSSTPSYDPSINHSILFGPRSCVHIPEDFLKLLCNNFDLSPSNQVTDMPSDQLAQLAELFSSFGSGFKYYTDDGKPCETTLFVKPAALGAWLNLALTRKYKTMRLCMHGSTQEGYEAVRKDSSGFSLQNAGLNGTAHGHGVYLALSDHVASSYNERNIPGRSTPLKRGSALLCLLLTDETMQKKTGQYEVFSLNQGGAPAITTADGLGNSIVVRSRSLCSCLALSRRSEKRVSEGMEGEKRDGEKDEARCCVAMRRSVYRE